MSADTASAIDALRQAWLDEHRGKPVKLDERSVWNIVWRLIRAGEQPTMEKIRGVNGFKGSPNTIYPHLHSFFEHELPRHWDRAPPASTPDPVLKIWEELRTTARAQAEQDLEPVRKELAETRAALVRRDEELLRRDRLLDERELGLQAHVRSLEQQLTDARTGIQVLNEEIDDQRRESGEFKDEIANLQRQAAEERATAREEAARREAKIEELQGALQTAAAELKSTTAAHTDERRALLHNIDKLEASQAEQRQALDVAQNALREAQQTHARLRTDRDGLREQLAASKEDASGARAELKALKETLVHRDQRISELQRLLDQLANTNARWEKEHARQDAAMKALMEQVQQLAAARHAQDAATTQDTPKGRAKKPRDPNKDER